MTKYLSVKLESTHKRELFTCGKPSLDHYLQRQASQDIKRNLSVVYVYPDQAEPTLIRGYYTLSNLSIPKEFAPESIQAKMPASYRSIPCTLLGRLAISKDFSGRGFGAGLLADSLLRALNASLILGSVAVVVDPLDDDARAFYKKYEFIELRYDNKMFLAMATIRQMFSKE